MHRTARFEHSVSRVVVASDRRRFSRHPVGLDDDERRHYGTREGVDPPKEGLAFPLFGPGGYNFEEKSSG